MLEKCGNESLPRVKDLRVPQGHPHESGESDTKDWQINRSSNVDDVAFHCSKKKKLSFRSRYQFPTFTCSLKVLVVLVAEAAERSCLYRQGLVRALGHMLSLENSDCSFQPTASLKANTSTPIEGKEAALCWGVSTAVTSECSYII